MQYVALLRGINVGGNNKVDMKKLVGLMEQAGFETVSSYINSGNILFASPDKPAAITAKLESLIETHFGINIKVLLRTKQNIDKVAAAIPDNWHNGPDMKCDVMFLWDKYDNRQVLDHISPKPDIDNVKYIDGTLIWQVDRKNVTKSGLDKIIGTALYAHMTIRNCNTVRKIQARLQ